MELNCVLKIAGCAEELIKLLHLNNQSCDDHFAKISVAKAVDAMNLTQAWLHLCGLASSRIGNMGCLSPAVL